MKALFLSILALLPAAASAQRDTLGVLERSSVFSAEDERAVAGFHTESPAMMLYRSEQSLSQISLRIDLRREQEALLQPLGDGAFDGGFYAESYRRLSERSATWADARYVRGNRRNVCWNSTADYLCSIPASRRIPPEETSRPRNMLSAAAMSTGWDASTLRSGATTAPDRNTVRSIRGPTTSCRISRSNSA